MIKKDSLLRNPVSYFGLGLLIVCTAVGLPLMFFDIFGGQSNPYAGIFIYAILPGLSTCGVGIAALGAMWEHRQRRRHPNRPPAVLPRIDLNIPEHRLWLVGSLSAGLLIAVLLAVTSYRAYNFTESVQFCGEVCHDVMKPEYTAYKHSPHARVACVECHVGSGAGWYVQSKVSGAYQVYSVLFKKFSRPIETPVHDLRPAQETCEQCHWPAKFFGAQQKSFTHFMADEANSPWQIQTLIKIGGGDPKGGASMGGIHYHMNIANEISYVATDRQRQTIPYVKAVDKDGHVTEYMSTDSPLAPGELQKSVLRRMDCVECHNRPSHVYHAPDNSLDHAFETAGLDTALPYLKREGMRVLAATYKTEAEAKAAILKEIPEFYAKNYPALARTKALSIQQATETLQSIYSATIFPEMKTDWKVHPNNIGHLNSDGCFRCHDGLHKSQDGKVITKDCGACHTFLGQGKPSDVAKTPLRAQPFKHPVDAGVDMNEVKCSVCHNGTIGL